MVGSCPSYGGWSHSKIHPLRGAVFGEENHLRYKDVCLRDMKVVDIDTMSWEGLAADRTKWRSALKQHLKTGEDKLMAAAADNDHAERMAAAPSDPKPHIDVMSAIKSAIPTLIFQP